MQLAILLPGLLLNSNLAKAEIQTLFSTPQERQIINANRYKTDVIEEPDIEHVRTDFVAPTAKEEVNISFVISGITISNNGPHSVWINNLVYEDGEHLADNSHIKVLNGKQIRVRITTPDGKIYYSTSGETINVTYRATVEN